ncbi:hypothetical protein RHMOL_Rhmol01G0376200 [Rhododendron molle]|uniref:Uncharacterized protein n=2 Tax=Rhododendron molle TaxID=49168 RepID=A0ACC0QDB2_RHOML|nr:hypothetical protein RHMOL_Rhmol01G0376200 [Rhododendron molle]KAI8574718.1 hypothetical protein RHMOL_Rhmol01G0376200 [Rhododendron molle]
MESHSDQKKEATIIDGKAIAQTIRSEIASEVRHLSDKYGKMSVTFWDVLSIVVTNLCLALNKVVIFWNTDLRNSCEFGSGPRTGCSHCRHKERLSKLCEHEEESFCAELGIKTFDVDLPEQVPEDELISKVHELNADPDVHGILVQLPLPKHVNEEKVLSEITIEKDVDGFHPLNIGKLAMKGREPLLLPCTPKATYIVFKSEGYSKIV